MKKMIVTIVILLIIFIGMVIYRNSEKETEIKIDEVNQIENYMKKIYGFKEITDEALPEFNNINEVKDKWLWGTIRQNIDDYEIDYETIENTIKDLFNNSLNKQYPKEGTEFITYNSEKQKYITKELTIDAVKDSYLVNKIEKNNTRYTIEIIEYLVDYTESENNKVVIKNLNEKNIYELTEEEATEGNIMKIVKENIDKFSKKKVTIEKEGENLVIKKVEKEK